MTNYGKLGSILAAYLTLFVFFALPIGTATATRANTYGRLRTLANVKSTTFGHVLTPRPPTSKREPFCHAFGKIKKRERSTGVRNRN